MVDDFPSPEAGNAGIFSKNIIGQPVNGINRAADVIKHGREAVGRLEKSSASGEESDSATVKVCTVCGDTLNIDAPKKHHTTFDTIKVENK